MNCIRNARRLALATSLALAGLTWIACSPDRERLGPVDGGDGQFTLGPATTYAVEVAAGGSVADSISGGTFAFPNGGSGTLTVARIVESPLAPPEGASGFSVEYTGNVPMELRLERTAESIPLLWIYGFGDVSPAEPMTSENTWWAMMPEDTVSNPAVFWLAPPGKPDEALARASGAGRATAPPAAERPVHSYRCMIRKVSPDYPEWAYRNNLQKITALTIQDVIAGLPPGLRSHAWDEVGEGGRIALRSYEIVASDDVSSYSAFSYPLGNFGVRYRRLFPMMHFVCSGPKAATEATVAHEVGHYMTHAFFGDDAFEAFSDGQLMQNHDVGVEHPQRDMLEEYAMFTDYFMNDDISGGVDVTEPRSLLQKSPSIVDLPALEGYACGLMTRMIIDRDSIETLQATKEDIPVVGASFNDMFNILFARKPTTVNALRGELALYLANRNQADRLPAILERTGWSYHGTGVVVDGNSRAIEGAEVQSVCKVASQDGREYLAPLDPVLTNRNGQFTLPRIFPGTHTIRVKTDNAEQEFVYTVNPDDPTDGQRAIGTLTMEESLLGLLHQLRYAAVSVEGIFSLSDGNELWAILDSGYGYGKQGTWTGTEFVLQTADSTESHGQVSGMTVRFTMSFSPTGLMLQRLQCHVVQFLRVEGQLWSTLTTDFDIDEIPHTVTSTDTPGRSFVWYELDGGAIDANLRTISRVERYYQPPRQITLTNVEWTRPGQEGHVRVNLLQRVGAQ